MKYLLGVGITVKKYHKEPRFRLYLGERMIDEFTLDGTEHFLLQKGKAVRFEGDMVPKCYRIYVIDTRDIEHLDKFTIDVNNNDSNYTNGFMTKSTLVNLYYCFLMPISYIMDLKNNQYNALCEKFKQIIPKKLKGQIDYIDNKHIMAKDRLPIKGYPFPFETFWNGNSIGFDECGPIGGSGAYHVNIIKRSNVYLFDTADHQFIPEDLYINNHTQPTDWQGSIPLTGFPLSKMFIEIVQGHHLDKYLHEDK